MKILLVEVRLSKEETKVSTTVFKYKKGIIFPIGINKLVNLKEKKNLPAVIAVSGAGVVTRVHRLDSPDLIKLTGNDKLVVQYDNDNSEQVNVSFFRRETIDDIVMEMKKNGIVILDIIICNAINPQADSIQKRLQKTLTFRYLTASKSKINALFELIFRKIKLPVLAFFFMALLSNFFLNNYLRTLLERKQITYNRFVFETRERDKNDAAIARLTSDYFSSSRSTPLSLICDRIASYIPDGIFLEEMSVNPIADKIVSGKKFSVTRGIVRVKGVSDAPLTVTVLCRNINEDAIFESAKIVSISDRKGEPGKLDFELSISVASANKTK